ncbi:tetratricopeptide repeat protein [Vibrio sp.]|uniref:tetratricopeptide repeat protein n=1 Tax=Vibrio sp. TaxID=678 RepID=UPI003D146FB6
MRYTVKTVLLLIATLLLSGCAEPGEETYNKGVKALSEGKPGEARVLFLQALEENPQIAEAYLNLGRIDIKQGTYAKARENTLKALEMLEESQKSIISGATWEQQAALACNNMASIAFQQALEANKEEDSKTVKSEDLFNEAETWLAKAAELDPENEIIQKNKVFIQKWSNK